MVAPGSDSPFSESVIYPARVTFLESSEKDLRHTDIKSSKKVYFTSCFKIKVSVCLIN